MAKKISGKRVNVIGKLFGFEVHLDLPKTMPEPDRSFHLGNGRKFFEKAITHEAFFSLLKEVQKP